MVENLPACAEDAGDSGSILGLGRSPGGGNGNPLQYSCLGNHTDGGAWGATVHGVAKSWTRLSDYPHIRLFGESICGNYVNSNQSILLSAESFQSCLKINTSINVGFLFYFNLERTFIVSLLLLLLSLFSCVRPCAPHRRQPTRLPRPWDSPGKNTGVGCHFLLHLCVIRSINFPSR